MEWAATAAPLQRVSTPAEREKCRRALETLWSPGIHFDSQEAAAGLRAIFRHRWVPRPAEVPGVDAERAARLSRGVDVELRAKVLFRMLRTQCHHSPDTPGRFVAMHPRVVRGPNSHGPIRIADSPVGLVRT